MKRRVTTALGGINRIAGGLAILVVFPAQGVYSGISTIRTPGPYPYETPGQVPAPPPVLDSSPLPSPAPFPYPESSPSLSAAQDHNSRIAGARRPLSAKAVREAAFKYNGVANFCGFLAALPANVSVFDPKLGSSRALVQGGQIVPKNVTWLRKRKEAANTNKDERVIVSGQLNFAFREGAQAVRPALLNTPSKGSTSQ